MGVFSKIFNKKEIGGMEMGPSDIPPPPEFESFDDLPPLPPEMEERSRFEPKMEYQPSQAVETPVELPPLMPEEPELPPLEDNAPIEQESYPNPHDEIEKRREYLKSRNEPVFAKVDDYRGIIQAAEEMKVQIRSCEEILKRLNEIRLEADREHLKWKNELLDVYKKFGYVDKVISELEEG